MNNPDITTAVIGLVGAAIGGGLTMLGQHLIEERRLYARKRSIAHSIASEIEAYLDLMERREHVKYARQIIASNKGGARQLPKNWISGFEKEFSPFPVISANLSEIGLLDSLSSDVANFYFQVMAVRTTIISADEGKFDQATAADLAIIFQAELDIWIAAVARGRTTIRVLRGI